MEQAIKYGELMENFTKVLGVAAVIPGRRFDRITIQNDVRYFVDRHTWEIFGSKSSFQYNPRRWYGKLDTVNDMDWNTLTPKAGSVLEAAWNAREGEIKKNYKARGRPRKAAVTP